MGRGGTLVPSSKMDFTRELGIVICIVEDFTQVLLNYHWPKTKSCMSGVQHDSPSMIM